MKKLFSFEEMGNITNNQLPAQDNGLFCYRQCSLFKFCLLKYDHSKIPAFCVIEKKKKKEPKLLLATFTGCEKWKRRIILIQKHCFFQYKIFSWRLNKKIVSCLCLHTFSKKITYKY